VNARLLCSALFLYVVALIFASHIVALGYHQLNQAQQEFNLLKGTIELPGECWSPAV